MQMSLSNFTLFNFNHLLWVFNNYAIDEQGGDNGSIKDLLSYILSKLKEWCLAVGQFFQNLVWKIDEIFPPETRSETFQRCVTVAIPLLIAGLVLFLCFCCCKKCCCGGRRSGRMMKAPGRDGTMIPRAAFARDPKSYFQNLHAGRRIEELL